MAVSTATGTNKIVSPLQRHTKGGIAFYRPSIHDKKTRKDFALGGGARHAEIIASAHFRWPFWRSVHWIFGGPCGSATEFDTTRLGTECRPGADRAGCADRAARRAAPQLRRRPRPSWTKLSSSGRARPNTLRWNAKSTPRRRWIPSPPRMSAASPIKTSMKRFPAWRASRSIAATMARVGAFRCAATAGGDPRRNRRHDRFEHQRLVGGWREASTGGRAADLRELPAAMIKSIDVFKGTTAAMTEGSLGGSVRIETRNALEFDKPFIQFSTDGQRNSITETLTPGGSAMFARSFMDNRFGVIGNVNYSKFETTSDAQQPQTSGNAGPFRNADFDQSPDKTFTYDPSIVDPTATAGNFRVFGAGGVPIYASLSPIEILTRSAAAASPAACLAAFPALTTGATERHSGGRQRLGHCPGNRRKRRCQPHRGAAGADEWIADLPEPMERLRTFAHSCVPEESRGRQALGPIAFRFSGERGYDGLCRLSEGGPPRHQRRQHAQSRQPGL